MDRIARGVFHLLELEGLVRNEGSILWNEENEDSISILRNGPAHAINNKYLVGETRATCTRRHASSYVL